MDRWTNHGHRLITDTAISHWAGGLDVFGGAPKVIAITMFEELTDKCGLRLNIIQLGPKLRLLNIDR